ncbi:MAG: DUF4384 domain-containing protein [Bryobacterales bacterium]|nr:DUF4384 domain-containing protein [Bryobacterales bacterium]
MHMYRLLIPALVAIPCLAQEQAGAKALFHDPTSGVAIQSSRTPAPGGPRRAPQAAAKPAAPGAASGLMYWVELLGANGQVLRVNSSRMFKSGERIRLHVTSNVPGRLTIMQSQDAEPYSALFPTASAGDNRVEPMRETVIPGPKAWMRFDKRPGQIRLLMLLDADQPKELMARAAPIPQQPAPAAPAASHAHANELERLAESLRGSKALVVETDESPGAAADYVVLKPAAAASPAGGQKLAVEVRLQHVAP